MVYRLDADDLQLVIMLVHMLDEFELRRAGPQYEDFIGAVQYRRQASPKRRWFLGELGT